MGRHKELNFSPGRLWPKTPSGQDLEIEVFGATGEYQAGKTILGLSIAPGTHPAGHPFAGQPRTLVLDMEKSSGTYAGTGCKRIDVPAEMLKKFGQKPYGAIDVFRWFNEDLIGSVAAGQYDVILADPVTDIESGMVEFVKTNCQSFGLTTNQIQKSGGLLWGVVKDFWKQILLKLSSRCRCFYFTAHMRDVWAGDKPSGRREPKGKETLMELSSLYLLLERKPDKDGRVPAEPSAIVLKQRLADTVIQDGQLRIVNLMPPRLPVATYMSICRYIASPPDYGKLKDGELAPEETMSADDRLRMEVAKAEAERDSHASRLAIIQRQGELQAADRAARAAAPAASDQSARLQAERTEKKAANAAAEAAKAAEAAEAAAASSKESGGASNDSGGGKPPSLIEQAFNAAGAPPPPTPPWEPLASQEMVASIAGAIRDLKFSRDTVAALCERMGVKCIPELSQAKAEDLLRRLEERLAKARAGGGAAGSSNAAIP